MKWKLRIAVAIVLAGALVFGACSAGNKSYNAALENADYNYEATGEDASLSNKSGSGGENFELATDENLKIVWKGSVSMESTEYDDTISDLRTLFAKYGVQIMSSEESGGVKYESSGITRTTARYATYVVRVPSENFGDLMEGFGTIRGSVTASNRSRADMTKQYNSNELSLELLNTEYEDLKKLLSEAKDLSEIMMIRDRMTEVMTEIRTLSEANNRIDYDVQYSNVTLSLREVVVYTDPNKNESWFTRFGKSFVSGAQSFASGLGDFGVWLGGNIFQILLFGAIFVALPIIIIRTAIKKKRERRRRKAKEEAKAAEEAKKAAEEMKKAAETKTEEHQAPADTETK